MIKLISPADCEELNLLDDIQQNYIENEEYRKNVDGGKTFKWNDIKRETNECSIPLPVVFKWESDADCRLELSFDSDFSSANEYAGDGTVEIYNLEYGDTYFWRVKNADGELSETRSFSIRKTPRFLYIDGTTNVRDIAFSTFGERKVKRGLFYRGSEFNVHVNISEKGLLALKNDIHIKTDLDVRGPEIDHLTESPAEKMGIQWIKCSQLGYMNIFDEDAKENMVKLFDLLADRSIYPIYTHCWGGADRTGCICFIVEALLGVEMQDLILDYELTSLSVWGVRTRNYSEFIKFVDYIKSFGSDDDDFSVKTRLCLKQHFGIKESVLDEVCDILKA